VPTSHAASGLTLSLPERRFFGGNHKCVGPLLGEIAKAHVNFVIGTGIEKTESDN
jgi:hypothetical protein